MVRVSRRSSVVTILWTPTISLSMYLSASYQILKILTKITSFSHIYTKTWWVNAKWLNRFTEFKPFSTLTGFHGILKQKGFVYKTYFYNNGCIVSYRLYKQSSLRTKNSKRALFFTHYKSAMQHYFFLSFKALCLNWLLGSIQFSKSRLQFLVLYRWSCKKEWLSTFWGMCSGSRILRLINLLSRCWKWRDWRGLPRMPRSFWFWDKKTTFGFLRPWTMLYLHFSKRPMSGLCR